VSERVEQVLRVATPVAAIATVALGLRVGAPDPTRSAVVVGAPASAAGTGLSWQVTVFDDGAYTRQTLRLCPLRIAARQGDQAGTWTGQTNDDGVAEVSLPFVRPEGLKLEVFSGDGVLASGEVTVPHSEPRATAPSPWARFARRDGGVVLEVAVLGQRAASGYPATLWVRATDAASHAPLAGVTVEPEADSSFVPRELTSKTDARGWAKVVATPWGHAVSMMLRARASDGRVGEWAGVLDVSPGAAQLEVADRIGLDESPVLEVTTQTTRPIAYVEIDDAHGRAWGAAAPFVVRAGEAPRAVARAPKLAPGLYWAIAADDASGASLLGPGTSVRPFFVARDDEAALAFGPDRAECSMPLDVRDATRTISVCLALAAPSPVPRWVALEGLSRRKSDDDARRSRGLALALVAIVVGAVLELLLLVRATVRARARLRAAAALDGDHAAPIVARGTTALMAVLVAMLGFALLAAFVGTVR
jgi:hypothetical protein